MYGCLIALRVYMVLFRFVIGASRNDAEWAEREREEQHTNVFHYKPD